MVMPIHGNHDDGNVDEEEWEDDANICHDGDGEKDDNDDDAGGVPSYDNGLNPETMMMMMMLAGSPVCGDYSVPTFGALNSKSHLYSVNNPLLKQEVMMMMMTTMMTMKMMKTMTMMTMMKMITFFVIQ